MKSDGLCGSLVKCVSFFPNGNQNITLNSTPLHPIPCLPKRPRMFIIRSNMTQTPEAPQAQWEMQVVIEEKDCVAGLKEKVGTVMIGVCLFCERVCVSSKHTQLSIRV